MRDELSQKRRVPEMPCLSPDGRPLRVGFMPREAAFFVPSAGRIRDFLRAALKGGGVLPKVRKGAPFAVSGRNAACRAGSAVSGRGGLRSGAGETFARGKMHDVQGDAFGLEKRGG